MQKTLSILLIICIQVSSLPVLPAVAQEVDEPTPTDTVQSQVVADIQKAATATDSAVSQPSQDVAQTNFVERALMRKAGKLQLVSKKNLGQGENVQMVVENAQSDTITATLEDPKGEKTPIRVSNDASGSKAIMHITPPDHFQPGRYTLIVKDMTGTTQEQDFTWGVLAINPDKSVYAPHEKANLAIAVLNEKGEMVCDADVTLSITSPDSGLTYDYSTQNKQIKVNPECTTHGFTLKPDYEMQYQTTSAGTYSMKLTAKTKNGTYSITDAFQVQDDAPFAVQRVSATRIYPPNRYPVEFNIVAKEDFEGTVSETVPYDFTIIPTETATSYDDMRTVYADPVSQNVLGASTSALLKPFDGNFKVTEGFGAKVTDPELRKFYAQFGLAGHDGVDFGLPNGTKVQAVADGDVLLAGDGDYGTTIVIKHGWGKSYYGHLSEVKVKAGDQIKAGQEIGLSGNTGESTGPHLHFGIKPNEADVQNGYFGKIDPSMSLGMTGDEEVLGASSVATSQKVLTWKVSLKKGEKIKLGYAYKAPKVSPQFYTLGPLRFVSTDQKDNPGNEVFVEPRKWQIASDAIDPSVGNGTIITSIPRSIYSMTTEQVGGTNAHVAVITSPTTRPSYKYQFLTNGLRLMIDKKDGNGFVQAISQVQTVPEYMKQQGANGNFVWNPYGLNINTTGASVLQGFNRLDQTDGTIKMVRTYSTTEEGVAETLTETWTVPSTVEEFAVKGPKVTYSMTKNRGIVIVRGVQEGTWRMRWAISGIADITANSSNMRDASNWPIRHKTYGNGSFTVDVNDFDNTQTTANFTYSEVAINNKAEVLFYPNGMTGTRTIDPAIVATNLGQPWLYAHQRIIHFNGSHYFLLYTKNSTIIYYRAASTIEGLATATETTLITGFLAGSSYSFYWPDDSKFDLTYSVTGPNLIARTCTVSGIVITCGTASTVVLTVTTPTKVAITRDGTGVIWIHGAPSNQWNVWRSAPAGDITGSTTWSRQAGSTGASYPEILGFSGSNRATGFNFQDRGGTASDGVYVLDCNTSCTETRVVTNTCASWCGTSSRFGGNGVRVSDSDFRYAYVDFNATSNLIEGKWTGAGAVWSTTTIDSVGGQSTPSMFYDSSTGDQYIFYSDGATPKSIQRYYRPSGGAWGTKTEVDSGEGDANTLPMTMAYDVPPGTTRYGSRQMPWCYLNANAANFDIVCTNSQLAPGMDQVMRHGKWFSDSNFEGSERKPFRF